MRVSSVSLATCLIVGLITSGFQYLVYLLFCPPISYQAVLVIQFATFWAIEANENYKNKKKLQSYIAAYG